MREVLRAQAPKVQKVRAAQPPEMRRAWRTAAPNKIQVFVNGRCMCHTENHNIFSVDSLKPEAIMIFFAA